jgi:TolA-binding protein
MERDFQKSSQQLINGRGLLSAIKDVAQILHWLLIPALWLLWTQNVSITDLRTEMAVMKNQVANFSSIVRTKDEANMDMRGMEKRITVMEERLETQRATLNQIILNDVEIKKELEEHRDRSEYQKKR